MLSKEQTITKSATQRTMLMKYKERLKKSSKSTQTILAFEEKTCSLLQNADF